jgi:hypothetical protein
MAGKLVARGIRLDRVYAGEDLAGLGQVTRPCVVEHDVSVDRCENRLPV